MAGPGGLTPDGVRALVGDRVPPGPVVVALSGGADSAVLAWCLAGRPGVRAVTIDHGLAASDALCDAAEAIAAGLGLAWSRDTIAPASDSETDLREARLAVLEAAAGPDAWIVTGHTADDQSETVLGNLLRGAGPGGLSGIPRARGRFVRPLLTVPRSETRRLAAVLGLPFLDDPTNEDLTIRRNRLRLETLPTLAAAYNPALDEALARTARFAAADDEALETRAVRVPLRRDEEAVLIPASALRSLPEAVAARVVRRAIRTLLGPHAGTSRTVSGVLAVATGSRVGGLEGGLTASREGPFVAVTVPAPPPPPPVVIAPSGSTPFGVWRFVPGAGTAIPVGRIAMVRPVRPGDRIAGRGGSHRVAEVLRAAGVPVRLRSRWPVVTSTEDGSGEHDAAERGRIAWVVGIRVAPIGDHEVMRLTATREAG